jgi:hypothetical protein
MSASIRWGVPQAVTEEGAGSAIGDATASAVGASIAAGAGSAIGDCTCSGVGASFAETAGSAIGDATASGTLVDAGTVAVAAPRSLLGFWMGGAEAPQAPVTLAEGDGSAIGDATCSGTLEATAECAGTATGDATCEGTIEDATPVVVTPPVVDAGGVGRQTFPGAWGKPVKKPKKKKRLDELDEMIAELRSRVVEAAPDQDDFYERRLRVSAALAQQPDPSLREIENQIALLQEAINEIDDEEAILLLAA